MNYYISDLHLNHKNVLKFDNRPFKSVEEMNKVIERNWNAKITNADTVYILGDVIWILNDDIISMFARLKGHKILILGNHDSKAIKEYRFSKLFDEICTYKELSDNFKNRHFNLVLSHAPQMMWNGQHKGYIHLYGHVHNSREWTLYKKYLKEFTNDINDLNQRDNINETFEPMAINVGCMLDYMNYTPRTLQELLKSQLDKNN